MDIAALIIGTLALILGIINISVMLAKNFFSSHTVQLTPIDSFGPQLTTDIPGPPPMNPYKEIGDPLSEEEEKYFAEMARKKPGMRAL